MPLNFGLGGGKADFGPAPAAPPAEATAVEDPELTVDEEDEPKVVSTTPSQEKELVKKIQESEEGSPERQRLIALLKEARKRIAFQQAKKLEQIRGVKSKHAKQAAYGREVGDRPPGSGYLTEAETAMGGRSGYYSAKPATVSGLGQAQASEAQQASELDKAALAVEEASTLVKQLSAEVKKGVIPKSELAEAISDLRRKAAYVKGLSERAKGLSGYGEGFGVPKQWICIAAGLGLAYYFFYKRG